MNSRSLTLAIRLLTTACAGVTLASTTGCFCPEPWSEVENVELETTADILALARDGDEFVAVGTGGTVVHHGDGGGDDGPSVAVSNPTNVALRGVTISGATVVVGDAGTILSSGDMGATWVVRDSGISDDLLGIARAQLESGRVLVAIASGQVLYSTDDGATWIVVTAPAAGWGGLGAVFVSRDRVFVAGVGGTLWSTDNPAGAWLREDPGTTDEVIGGGVMSQYLSGSSVAIATASQVVYREDQDAEWRPLNASFDGEIAAFNGRYLATVNGTIYQIEDRGSATEVANVGLAPRAIVGGEGFLVAGEGGNAARAHYQECVGGRPWMIDGELATAALVRGTASAERCDVAGIPADVREQLATAWARDGLYEHASVASFARVVLELMSIGAPAPLIAASRRAITDELIHAERCFELASRYAGAPVGPGPLPLPRTLGRTGDPAAIALALFDDGCINESVAAAEAAVAAAECSDPQVRAVLERIAADERDHAALAWKTLRWLLAAHRHAVTPVLRQRLATLAVWTPDTAAVDTDSTRLLRDHGRLSATTRAGIQRRVFDALIVPLSRELLGQPIRAQA